jgi:hypothetical protein
MPPKPSFRVKLSGKQQENLPPNPPTTTTFALPGTIADNKLQRKLQRQSTFNSLGIQKSRLDEWDVNLLSSTSALSIQNSTTIAYGLPTPETLLNPLEIDDAMETEAHEESENYGAQDDAFPS